MMRINLLYCENYNDDYGLWVYDTSHKEVDGFNPSLLVTTEYRFLHLTIIDGIIYGAIYHNSNGDDIGNELFIII